MSGRVGCFILLNHQVIYHFSTKILSIVSQLTFPNPSHHAIPHPLLLWKSYMSCHRILFYLYIPNFNVSFKDILFLLIIRSRHTEILFHCSTSRVDCWINQLRYNFKHWHLKTSISTFQVKLFNIELWNMINRDFKRDTCIFKYWLRVSLQSSSNKVCWWG